MNKILITGASGQLGSAVISKLLESISSNQISVITRDEQKKVQFESKGFNAFLGSYENIASLELAMIDVDTVLLISSGDQGNRIQEHKNVIDAAKKMKVKNIAYTSRALRDRTSLANKLMIEHFQTEDYIKSSGLNYLFFRNALYMDAIPQFIGGLGALEYGIQLPAGEGKVAFALRSEMGEAMANVLLKEKIENKTYTFTGGKTYTFKDIAQSLSELKSKEVTYTAINETEYTEMMKKRNIPASLIQKIIDFITDIKNNQEADISCDLELHLARKPTELKEGLKILFGL